MSRIDLDDLSIHFTVRQAGRLSIKEYLIRGMFRESKNPHVVVRALRHVNLQLCDGDRLGIIGGNGAGKSTLLKVLAGVYSPTTGTYYREGRVNSLFDITLGFEGDANGWDNIRYRGYMQGESPASLRAKVAEIAEFSELGPALDMPLRYWSTGMVVRLGFSIATTLEPEILIIDEVLAAGDNAFQKKAKQRMLDLMNEARIVVLASHDMTAMKNLCNRILWLDQGQIREIGKPEDVMLSYLGFLESSVRTAA